MVHVDNKIQAFFENQAFLSPDHLAVIYNNEKITYRDLNNSAELLKNYILNNWSEEEIIGVSTLKNIHTITGILAILKAKKAYMPLDLNYPKDRLLNMVKISGIKSCVSSIQEFEGFRNIGLENINIEERALLNKPELPSKSNSAVIIFTSGSTGEPKGVELQHQGLCEMVSDRLDIIGRNSNEQVLQFTYLGFDASVMEIFLALSSGRTIHLIDEINRIDAKFLLDYVVNNSINRIVLPYVALQYFANEVVNTQLFPVSLREISTGGELLKITSNIKECFKGLPDARLKNGYGPTEATVLVTENILDEDPDKWEEIPSIGRPIADCRLFLLDENMELCKPNQPGEMYIMGNCLAKGYLNRDDLTSERFIKIPNLDPDFDIAYKTGDIISYNEDGFFYFKGRVDEQVKIRGNRVELGEIEINIIKFENVYQAVVKLDLDSTGQKIIVGYVQFNKKEIGSIDQLKGFLKRNLPDYMIPDFIVEMESFPKTASGKIDKKSLPKPHQNRESIQTVFVSPKSKTEIDICSLFERVLQFNKIGVTDNFFEFGGNSLKAQTLISLLRSELAIEIPVIKLYQFPTVQQLLEKSVNSESSSLLSKFDKRIKSKRKSNSDVAVIGMAGRFPGANNIQELWDVLKSNQETIKFFKDSDLDPSIDSAILNNPNYVKARGIVNDVDKFDAAFFGMNKVLAEMMDPQQRLFLEIAHEVLESTGYRRNLDSSNIGVYAGVSINTYFLNNLLCYPDKIKDLGDFQINSLNEKDYVATRTAYHLNLTGPAVSVYSACSTSLLAVVQAVESIRLGNCEMALAGGASVKSPIVSGHLYEEGAAYSKDGHCKSFDADAKGTVFSDGAGVVLLKNMDAAKRDGDKILAIIKGVGVNNDGGNKGSFSAPSIEGQAIAIRTAIEDARIHPDQIAFIEAHGTGTPLGDPIEIEGLKLAFGKTEKKNFCAIGSIKSYMGHLNGAAGISGFIKAILTLQHKKLVPIHGFQKLNPNIKISDTPFYINDKLQDFPKNGKIYGGVSSFGVGGTNVHVILTEAEKTEESIIINEELPYYLINWSAKSANSLQLYAEKLASYILKNPQVRLQDIASTLQLSRHSYPQKAFLIAENKEKFVEELKKIALNGVVNQKNSENRDVAFLFPGQGAQYLQMGKSLYDHFEIYKLAIDECIQFINPIIGVNMKDIIFPEEVNLESNHLLKDTKYTQPAIFITEYALGKLWIELGVSPLILCGHSIGEFNAAVFAGVMSLEDALRLVCKRGQLMSELPSGSMLAVRSQADQIKSHLPEGVSIAAINTPNACVVSGKIEVIKDFSLKLQQKGTQSKILETSHAFHSQMMLPALGKFEEEVSKISLHRPKLPIVSTVTGLLLKDDEAMDPKYWSNQILNAVLFSDAVLSIEENGAFNFLEVGPGNVLSSLVRQHNLKSNPLIINSISSCDETQTEFESFLRAIAKIWQSGVSTNFFKLYKTLRFLPGLPTYAFDKQRYWLDPVIKNETKTFGNQRSIQPEVNFSPQNTMIPMEIGDVFSQKIQEIILNATGVQMPDGQVTFSEMGLDSLILTQLGSKFRNEFGIPLTFKQLNEDIQSVDQIAAYVEANISKENKAKYMLPATNQTNQQSQYNLNPENHSPTFGFQEYSLNENQDQNSMINLIAQQIELLSKQLNQMQQHSLEQAGQNTANKSSNIQFTAPANKPLNGDKLKIQPLEAEKIELKKPIGSPARIQKKDAPLSDSQKHLIDEHVKRYVAATKSSKDYTQEHRPHMADPSIVSGFRASIKELIYSPVVNRSLGSRIWDIDGNEYLDVLNGFGSIIYGHHPDFINERLKEQFEKGYEISPHNPISGEVCKLICDMTEHDRAALCNTGSEAVMGAMRIARTATGRRLIVSFSGSFHGVFDEAIVGGTLNMKVFPAANGIKDNSVHDMLVLDYGTEESLEIIRSRKNEIAAVLVEPIQSRRPEFRPIEFLKKVREITAESGAVLIFDEVISGFRMHPKGAQGIFKIKADICTYGKVIGGGLSIGAIAGSKKFMDALDGSKWNYGDDSLLEIGVKYFAETFVINPLALVSAKASLEYLKNDAGKLQHRLTVKTNQLAEDLNLFFEEQKLPFDIVHFGSLWEFKPKYEVKYTELLFSLMREKGIHIYDGYPCFMTAAHTDEDIKRVCQTFKTCVTDLMEAGFFNENRILENA